jgi:hypothetical protein
MITAAIENRAQKSARWVCKVLTLDLTLLTNVTTDLLRMATFMSILFFSLMPDPPFTAPKRGIIRTWRRSRFIHRREDEVEEIRKAEEWREIVEEEENQEDEDVVSTESESSDEDLEILPVKKCEAEKPYYRFSFYEDWTVVEKKMD